MTRWLDQFAEAISDRYRLERELGQGGMATVYLAQDLRHHRPVALKVLRPEEARTVGHDRFMREIAIVAPMVHPHIVSLLDSGEAAGTFFYVMPYLPGESLRTRLNLHGELPVADSIRLMRGVLQALTHAHELGIVHRDIKPENILLAGEEAQVADFGIARAVKQTATESVLTGTGMAIGTTAYMAPEQAAGDPKIDHRADLYSAGLLWYELLAGHHPYADLSPQQQLVAHLTRPVAPLDQVRPSVPPALVALIARCLEKRPADRWQHANDILHELDRLLRDSGGGHALPASAEPMMRSLRLEESLLDTLEDGYDPRMPGDTLRYLDNGKISAVLVCYFNRWSTDPEDGAALLRQTNYRAIAPAMFGFEARRRYRVSLTVDDHLRLVRGVLDSVIASTEPRHVILVGFSAGADLAFRLAAQSDSSARRVDAIIALSPNLVKESAFASAVLAQMTVNSEDEVLPYLRQVVDAQQTLQEWADVSEYLARLARRFRRDFDVLQKFAHGISSPFEMEPRLAAFARWYTAASKRGLLVRCIFEDNALCRDLMRELQRAQKDRQLLGVDYQPGSLLIEPGTMHFDLEDPNLIQGHLESFVAMLEASTDAP